MRESGSQLRVGLVGCGHAGASLHLPSLRGHAGVIHGALQELEASLGDRATSGELFLSMAKRGVKRILRTADRLQQTGQIERGTLDPRLSTVIKLAKCFGVPVSELVSSL